MHEGDKVMAAQQLGCYKEKDLMSQMTCGENLERKIAEQTERLMMLEAAKKEMQDTGLYNVKIFTLRDTMSW